MIENMNVNTIQTSLLPENNLELVAKKDSIEFVSLPIESTFDRIQAGFTDKKGKVLCLTEICRKGNRTMSAKGLKPGDYSLILNIGDEFSTPYLYGNDVNVRYRSKTIEFINPLHFHENCTALEKALYYADKTWTLEPSRAIPCDHQDIVLLSSSLTDGIPDILSKAKVIHNWVSGNIYYNYDNLHKPQTALDILHSRRGVCAGYAMLTVALLRAAGIPSACMYVYVCGHKEKGSWYSAEASAGRDTHNHLVAVAFINNEAVLLDPTWDSGNFFHNGRYVPGKNTQKYFIPSVQLISGSHCLRSIDWGT